MIRLGFLHIELTDPYRFRELARRMVVSAKEAMPGIEIVQMTDMRTPIIRGVDDAQLVETKEGDEFMPYRLKHLSLFEGDGIFLDTDIIVKRDLREAFDEPFEVGLTKRDYPIFGKQTGQNLAEAMPYNTGVMFSRSQGFWRDCYEYCLSLPKEKQQWWGDQLAVKAIAESGEYKVKVFNCETWNRVPVRSDDLGDAYAVHYKGEKRKEWMLA